MGPHIFEIVWKNINQPTNQPIFIRAG